MDVSKALALDLDDDQSALADAVRRFLADSGLPRAGYGEPAADRSKLWRGLVDIGVVGALVPESAGGLGLGLADLGGVLVELGRACSPAPLISSGVVAATFLRELEAGDLLTHVAAGDRVAVLVDNTGVRLDGSRANGSADLVADATAADVFVIASGGEALAVPADAAAVTPTATLDGSRGFGSVRFEDASGTRLNGDADAALRAARDAGLTAWLADGLGAATVLLELAMGHALTREQFGVPIGSFQAVQHALVDAYATVEAGKAGVSAALAAAGGDADERHRMAVMAGAWCCDGFAQLAATAIQVLGGIGFTWEHDAHMYYKRLLTLQTAYGGSSAQLAELADLTV